VINLEPQSVAEVLESVCQLGAATGREAEAGTVVRSLQARIDNVTERSAQVRQRPRVALLEWIDPPFSCGHWTPELVRRAGGIEGLGVEGQPSRRLNWSEVLDWRPEVLVLACCGFSLERTALDVPLLRSYAGWQELPCVQTGRVYMVDGSAYFSRPGPRLVDSLEIVAHALHPEVHPLPEFPEPEEPFRRILLA
jgi:iron complex transport system substrate-binding protein